VGQEGMDRQGGHRVEWDLGSITTRVGVEATASRCAGKGKLTACVPPE
jgi:hypothetical protein